MQTVIGVFSDRFDADAAIEELKKLDYDPQNISVVMKNDVHTHNKGSKGGTAVSGAASGATAGGVLGGIAGLLIGLGAITIPSVGALLIGGPLAAAIGLTGLAAATFSGATTGVLAGGLAGALIGLGIPADSARMYEERIREGAVLLAVPVHSEWETGRVEKVFTEYGADQVRSIED